MMDIQLYLQQLSNFVQQQQQEINKLQASVFQLSADVQRLKDQPSVTVERLEYKFDQLKVETLEGTLNIGLNPSDLSNIEDLAVPTQTETNTPNVNSNVIKNELLNRLTQYVDQHIDTTINDIKTKTGIQLEPGYNDLIKEDIRKQIPIRTDHYIQFFNTQKMDERLSDQQFLEKIYETIIADINQGIDTFISQLSNQDRKEE